MNNEERWSVFINELRSYIEEHHLGPSKHTSLYNRCRYFKRKMKERATYKEEDVGRNIRMAYSVDDFHSTSPYSALHEYELAIEHQFLK